MRRLSHTCPTSLAVADRVGTVHQAHEPSCVVLGPGLNTARGEPRGVRIQGRELRQRPARPRSPKEGYRLQGSQHSGGTGLTRLGAPNSIPEPRAEAATKSATSMVVWTGRRDMIPGSTDGT